MCIYVHKYIHAYTGCNKMIEQDKYLEKYTLDRKIKNMDSIMFFKLLSVNAKINDFQVPQGADGGQL